MAKKIATELGSPELLVNNASVTQLIPLGDFEAVTDEVRDTILAGDTILAVNVLSMFYYTRVLAPYVKSRGQDAIVNVGSIAGLTGNGSSPIHAVSKAVVAGLTKSLAHALAPGDPSMLRCTENSRYPLVERTRGGDGAPQKGGAPTSHDHARRGCGVDLHLAGAGGDYRADFRHR